MTTTQPKRQPIPFGKYLLLDRINIGGMAEVWRGKMFGAGGFERLVAIKRILPNIAEDDEFISMFIDEAKISVQLAHANIAQIYELGEISNSYFIAMEYIPGKDMRAIFDQCRKKGEPAPVPLVAYVVSKMCEGLDYAHRKKGNQGQDLNIVHRDISPQNVLISFEGEVKVIDFGLAKAVGKASNTQAGILKGKFGYMSPEQIRGLNLDRRSDVFAIGVCLYEMLTGTRLFVGNSDFSVLEKVRKAEVAPPSTYNKRIPEALEKIVLKALALDVEQRYQYANELGDDLQRFLITSESIFGRKDLMQYMKATFAEDVECEKLRLQEYADIKPDSTPPEALLSTIETGFGDAAMPVAQPGTQPLGLEEEESGATMVVHGSEYFNEPTIVARQGRNTLDGVPRLQPSEPAVESATSPRGGRPSLSSVPALPSRSSLSSLPLAPRQEAAPVMVQEEPRTDPSPARVAAAASPAQGPVPAPAAPNRLPLIVALSALVVVLLGVVGFLSMRKEARKEEAPVGYVLMQLPSDVKSELRVSFNGEDLKVPSSGPILHQVSSGPGVVMVSAKGYKVFTQPVVIQPGTTPTELAVKLQREVQVARVVVVTQPPDAELKVEGKVVREKGSSATYLGEVAAGSEVVVAASAPGFEPVEKRLTLEAGDKPVDVQLQLEPEGFEVEVLSVPSGAAIFAGGKDLGVTTPTRVRLPAGVKQVSLKLRCYNEVDVVVAPAASGPAQVKGRLKKQRGCR